MLIPIPGLTHLKYLVPDPPLRPQIHKTPIPSEVVMLVRVAVDSTFGVRPISHMSTKRFDVAARAHVIARRKQGLVVAKLLSCHVQVHDNTAEVFGSIALRQRATAYAARLQEADGIWRMLTFRILN